MTQETDGDGRVREPDVAYRVPRRVKNRDAIRRAIRMQDEIFQRHANDPSNGRDGASIIREWRDRGCTS